MINNNPYNIPQKPLKQSKVVLQNPSIFPHQINRRNEEEYKMQHHHLLKRSTLPYFVENSVSQVVRIPMSPQPIMKSQPLQLSNVTQWQGRQSTVHTVNIWQINDRIQSINCRLQAQQRRLSKILDVGKFQKSTNLSESSSLYQDSTLHGISKQFEKYHNNEQSIDKIRQELGSLLIKNEKLNEVYRQQLKLQKQNITQELLTSFKQCLNDKFVEEEKKITDWLSLIATKNQQKISELRQYLKVQLVTISNASQLKHKEIEDKIKLFSTTLKQKMQETLLSFDKFKSNFSQFKEEIFDNILATQDHKQWLFKIDKAVKEIQNSHLLYNNLSKGMLKVSKDNCLKQIFHLRYEQYINIPEKSAVLGIKSEQRTYLVDEQGYLLDSNKYYIVDKSEQRIKIAKQQLQKLREHGLLI